MKKGLAFAALFLAFIGTSFSNEQMERVKNIKSPKLRNHLIDHIDIFGKDNLPAIYILGPGQIDMEAILLTRDFSRDPYFMHNVDREEFELGVTLRQRDEEAASE